MAQPSIEVLDPDEHPSSLLEGFQNQEDDLVRYLKNYAGQNAQKHRINQTFLAVDRSMASTRLAGYFTLAFCSVAASSAKDSLQGLRSLPRYPIPGMLLAQLAVDGRVQGQGLGSYLFDEALNRTLRVISDGTVPVRLFVTDAISEEAVVFYEKNGLTRISPEVPARMVCDLKPYLERLDDYL